MEEPKNELKVYDVGDGKMAVDAQSLAINLKELHEQESSTLLAGDPGVDSLWKAKALAYQRLFFHVVETLNGVIHGTPDEPETPPKAPVEKKETPTPDEPVVL